MHGIIWIRLRRIILVSIAVYLFLVLAVYYYLKAASFIVYPNTAYPPDSVDYHDIGNSILVKFQPNGYVRFEYVFDKPLYKGWVIYPYIERVVEYWGPGKLNISVYVVDVAPNLVSSYVFLPSIREHTDPPSNRLISSDYGAKEIKIIFLNEGGVPIELIISGVEIKVYPDIAYGFYSVYQWFEDRIGIMQLNPESGLLLGISLSFLPIPFIIIFAVYLRLTRLVD